MDHVGSQPSGGQSEARTSREARSLARACRYCGELPERHVHRCPFALYSRGEVRRCLMTRDHEGRCIYRGEIVYRGHEGTA